MDCQVSSGHPCFDVPFATECDGDLSSCSQSASGWSSCSFVCRFRQIIFQPVFVFARATAQRSRDILRGDPGFSVGDPDRTSLS